jgi:aminoglycoside phosphotransferase (APT) family kinase protein
VEHSAFHWVLRIAPPDSDTFVFYERNMMAQEPGIHALVRERTNVPVPEVIAYDTNRRALDRDFLILECMPGTPMSEARGIDQAKVLRHLGRYLRQVHDITARQYGYLGAHRPMQPQDSWAPAFDMMWRSLVTDVVSSGYYDHAERELLINIYEGLRHLFDREVRSSLLHMDVWAQNILVDEHSNVTALLDWDRALWGDPEIEFAVLDYCGISRPAFWEGYGLRRDTSHEARIRKMFYLLYELQKYIVIRSGRNNDPVAAASYKRQVMDFIERSGLARSRPI